MRSKCDYIVPTRGLTQFPAVAHEQPSGVPAVVLLAGVNEDNAREEADGRCHDDRLHQRGQLQRVIIPFMSLQDGVLL